MRIDKLHSWNITPKEAVRIQNRLLPLVTTTGSINQAQIKTVAGCDVSYSKTEGTLYAAVVLLSCPSLELLESAHVISSAEFPYIPGLLAFREGPTLLAALERLDSQPDLIMLDGHGVAHPRGLGIASHIGIVLDRPSVGVGKSVLCGHYTEPALEKGSYSSLVWQDKEVGKIVRTRSGVRPVVVSVGTKITLEAATRTVLACCGSYRLPEPVRQAHLLCNKLRTSK